MSRLPPLNLRAKIMVSVAVVVLLLGAATVGFIQASLSATLKDEIAQRGVIVARELAARGVDLVLTYNDLELHSLVHSTQSANQDVRYAFITDPRGRLLVHTFDTTGFPYDLLEANPLGAGQGHSTKLLLTEEGPILDVAAPIYDGKAGVAHVGMSYNQVGEAVATAVGWLVVETAGVLAAGLLLAYLVAGLLARPIHQLVQATRAVGAGDLEYRAAIGSRDEIGELGRAFNTMTEALRRSRDELLALASENALLFEQARERASQLATLNAVATAVSESPDPEEMLRRALDRILDSLHLEAGGILLWSDEAGGLVYRAHRGFPARLVEGVAGLQPGEGLAGRVFATGEPISVEDISEDPRLTRGVVREAGFRCFASVPVRCRGRVMGVLNVADRARRRLPEKELALLAATGQQLGIALENARLVAEAGKIEALRQLDRMKSEFVARASHELRTPVTSIRGYVETLLRDDMALDATTQRELFQDMDQISDRLSRLVHDLLNVSRIDVGKLEIRREEIPLGAALGRTVRRFRVQASGHTFRIAVPRALSPVLADPDRLDDVLDNLLSNAVKYSPGGGTITVGARLSENGGRGSAGAPGGPRLVISVADQGIGIPADELDRLFQRFYQTRDGSMARRWGIGLGLYLCKTYVEAMGGEIWAESEPGRGSSFSFTLPAADPPAPVACRGG